MPKISAKFDRGALRGHQMQVGWVKIGDFPQKTGYISKMVQDRHMVTSACRTSVDIAKLELVDKFLPRDAMHPRN